MKKIIYLSVFCLFIFASCDQGEVDPPIPIPWEFFFQYVDSSGVPIYRNLTDIPFNYEDAFWSNDLSQEFPVYVKKDQLNGVVFNTLRTIGDMAEEAERTGNEELTSLIYTNPIGVPDTLITKGIRWSDPNQTELIVFNGDTLFIKGGEYPKGPFHVFHN